MTTLPYWRYAKNKLGRMVFVLCLLSPSLHADWVLRNMGKGVLYFLLVPAEINAPLDLAEDPEKAKTLLKEKAAEMERIPSEGFLKVQRHPYPYLLLGFFVSPERATYPLVRAKIPLVPGEPSFTVGEQDIWKGPGGGTVSFTPWDVELPKTPIQVDNRYLDWLKVKEFKRLPKEFVPPISLRYKGGAPQKVPFEQSKAVSSKSAWVESVKLLLDEKSVYMMISSYSPMERGVSYWFYLLTPRGSEGLAIEIPIIGKSGPVLLWVPSQKNPFQIGTYVSDLFVLEGEALSRYLPPEAASFLNDVSQVWMSVSYQGKEEGEEFFLFNFPTTEIPQDAPGSP